MHQRRNNIIAISIFTAALIFLLLWIGLLCFPEEEPEENPVSEDRMSVVLNGMELLVPRDYHCYPDDSDLILYDDRGFSMRLSVLEDSFEELLLRKESLIPEVESKGYICNSPLEEQVTGTRSYLYFTINVNDGIRYVIYSNAGMDSHFGILADAGGEEPDRVLSRIHDLLASAQETDKKNTNIYDLLLEQAAPIEREEQEFYSKGTCRDAQGREILSYGIPEGFYADTGQEADMQNYNYINREADIRVTLYLKTDEGSAEECIQRCMESVGVPQTNGKQTDIDGRRVYYFAEEHVRILEGEREHYYRFYAAIDLEDGLLYRLTGFSMENEKALELETYTEFFSIEGLD